MSHEGIRIGPSAHHEPPERDFPRNAIDPAKVRIDKSGGTGLAITWKDGHQSHWTFAWLRDACPCATCNEERDASGRKPGQPKPQSGNLLPMFKDPPRPNEATPVGHYAVQFHWNDGHQSGIYSWKFLRTHCNCASCAAQS
jgi:DUF971 family protein